MDTNTTDLPAVVQESVEHADCGGVRVGNRPPGLDGPVICRAETWRCASLRSRAHAEELLILRAGLVRGRPNGSLTSAVDAETMGDDLPICRNKSSELLAGTAPPDLSTYDSQASRTRGVR